jgi:glucose uptake protein GlcU
MKRAYGILAWAIIALGIVHMIATWRRFDTFNASALWFLSGGIALVFTGSVNLLNRAYGAIAPGLLWFCRGANVVMLIVNCVGGVVTHASVSELAIVLGVMGTMTILSCTRSAIASPDRNLRITVV